MFIMGDSSFAIRLSTNFVNQLANESAKPKKKAKKPKTKLPHEPKSPQQSNSKIHQKQVSDDADILTGSPVAGWPLQSPLFMPAPPSPAANAELDAIRSVLQESEKVVERLQKEEDNMLQEVTQRAKDLHDKEFKLPNQKPMPCLEKYDACLKCYRENLKDPLKCDTSVRDFADCARRARQLVSSVDKQAT